MQTHFTWSKALAGNGSKDLLWSVRSMCKLNQIYSVHGARFGAVSACIVNWAALHVYIVITCYSLYERRREGNLQLISELPAVRYIGQGINQHQQMLMEFTLCMKYRCYTLPIKTYYNFNMLLERMGEFSSFNLPWTTVRTRAPACALSALGVAQKKASACKWCVVNPIFVCHRVENANKRITVKC